MDEWILIAALYVAVLGLWRLLGGFGSAGEAFREWGRASTAIPCDQPSR